MEDGQSLSSTRLEGFQCQLNRIENQQSAIQEAVLNVHSMVNATVNVVNPSPPLHDEKKVLTSSPVQRIQSSVEFIVKQNCGQCDFSCENVRDLRNHTRKEHSQRCEKCDFIIHSEEQKQKHMLVKHEGEDGVLWVADSIISNVDFDFLS